jgi:WD40 repeat protein
VESRGINRRPEWSPDATRIAFSSDRTGSDQIWVCDSQGRGLARLTELDGASIGSLRWSPDGGTIVFDCWRKDTAVILAVNPDTGVLSRLTAWGMRAMSPAWSADGQWLYFCSDQDGSWRAWRMPAGGKGEAQPVADGGMMALEAPDGRSLYYSKGPSGNGLWRLDLATGAARLATEGPQGDMWANWAVGTEGVYWLERTGGADSLIAVKRMGLAGGEAETIAGMGGLLDRPHVGFSVSADGRSGLVVQAQHESNQIVITERPPHR